MNKRKIGLIAFIWEMFFIVPWMLGIIYLIWTGNEFVWKCGITISLIAIMFFIACKLYLEAMNDD